MKIKEFLLPVAALVSTTVLANTDESNTVNQMTFIEVTGELLSRSLLQSGNSVVVFDTKTLESRPELRTVRDVLSEIPNITMVTGTGKAPTVRGIDGTGAAENANAFFAGSRARLNWQIDGRSATYNEIVFGDLGIWDLNQIEVLRGPQSTLAGRNAIAGTIRVETQDPTFEQQFTIRAEGGNLDQKRLSATYNQPLTEQFSVRFAADQFERRSPVAYEPYPGVENPADMEGRAIRGKLLYEGDDQYDTRIVVTLTDNKYTGPNGEIIDYPFNERRSNFPQQPVHVTHTKSVGVEYNAAINEQLELEVTASATDFNFERKSTPDGSKANVDTKEYVIEPRLRYQGDNGTQWVIGSRYYSSKQDDWIQFIVKQSFTDDSNNFAIYSEGAFPFNEKFELTAGLRYEKENRKREGGDPDRAIAKIESDNDYSALLPKLGLSYQVNEEHTIGLQLSRGYNAGGGGISFGAPIVNYEYDEEYVNSLELYGRQQWADNSISTSQNLFYSQYTDMQLPFDLTPENTRDEAYVVRNADKVTTVGFEFSADWRIDEQFNLYGSFALLDSEITDYPGSGLEGNSLFMVPSASMKLGGTWQSNNWVINVSGQYTDGWYTNISNDEGSKTDAFATFDTSLSYLISEQTKLYLSVRNIFDEDAPVALYPGTAPADSNEPDNHFDKAVLTQPRTISAGLQYTF
ncbi:MULTISPECIES: TonB-dependent receptor domain-containing protein [Pseudoalteromonas]|uniref:TonB-dependent receptor domain-containing protein n=1 Tax=Pseudoalteromonas TaxID=53246 RepID=UPI000311FC7C|nr:MULTISPECIES: TonB-dependent receptor [Pseudoalteromonas]MCF6146240.1 hypothetical protein [Pseudoalteromonas mariniglutinosa NCIMB 1770]